MKTRNILKLFSALFIINSVKAASTEPPKCTLNSTTGKVQAGSKCLYNDQLYENTGELMTFQKDGLYFYDNTLTECTSETTNCQILVRITKTNTQSKAIVETVSKGYYINHNDKIYYCTNKCNEITSYPENKYLIQNPISGKGLIKIENDKGVDTKEIKDGYYISGSSATDNSLLIQCKNSECKEINGSVNNVYIDESDTTSKKLIICQPKASGGAGTSPTLQCDSEAGTDGVNYINSSDIEKATKPLIKCSNGKCEATEVTESTVYYKDFLEPSKVIHCTSGPKCSKVDGTDGDVYVAKKDGEGETDGIIICSVDDGKIKCDLEPNPNTGGYYLNAGSDASSKQVIVCDNGCKAIKVNPGYYKDAKGGAYLECVNECKAITEDKMTTCKDPVGENEVSQACLYGSTDKKLVFLEKSTNVTVHEYGSSDLFSYTTVSTFPSINSANGITTLFRISKYGVERYIANGDVAVSPTSHQLITDVNNSVIGTDVDLYDCNSSSTKLCVKRSACTPYTYMFDSENAKAIYCDPDEKLIDVSANSGFYVDSTTTIGTRAPYVISCENSVCKHILPTVASYFINSGYDSDTKALIYCNGTSCTTTSVSTGNYIANQQEGIIICTSQTNCSYKDASTTGYNTNYVNSGANKVSYALISCNKTSCTPKAARNGYYFADNVSSLIYCESNNLCNVITPTVNYYFYADTSENGKNYIINCSKVATTVVCAKEVADTGSYLTNQSNLLITCSNSGTCKQEVAKPGYYQSAVKITINTSRDLSDANENELVSDIAARDYTTTYNIIECSTTNCELLTAEELANIPICEYSADKCYITLAYALGKSTVNSISAGGICTNADRSVFYFATDTIVVAPNVIAGTTTTYIYTTTTTNCIAVGKKYADLYYTVGSDIYRLNDGSVSHFFDSGNYFINVEKNVLVNGNNIDNYNDENVKLYQCNGSSCKIASTPENTTYFADVNKRILKFNVNSDSYSFAYEKDIICIFGNNKCTPNADLNGREFCITYKGEIALVANDIKNRETGECYKSNSINNYIYGYNDHLYKMNLYSATIVDENGYNIVSISTNNTISAKDYKNRLVSGNAIKIYGCQSASCKIYEPEENVYYFDDEAKVAIKKDGNSWVAPSTSGYALISSTPGEKYVYKFKTDLDVVTLLSKAGTGYYYTIDNEMYECNENDNECVPISETDYYFTNTGEIYYCVYDSENLEKTECTKQSCYVGQNYYVGDNYYRCEAGSYLTPIKSRNCKYDENVIVNFPTILKEEFPANIKLAIESIEKNNNSTAVAIRSNKKYLSVVPAIYTNCTYNVEETEATFDLVCINNFVSVNEEDDTVEICSIENLGFVECVDDEANPEKCTPSSAFTRTVFNFFTIAITVFASLYLTLF